MEQRVEIHHLSGSRTGEVQVFPIEHWDELAIGRDPRSAIRCVDATISRRHAAIKIEKGEQLHFRLVDLGSSNGTWVNGHKVASSAELFPGDTVQIGGGESFVFDLKPSVQASNDDDDDERTWRVDLPGYRSTEGFPAPSETVEGTERLISGRYLLHGRPISGSQADIFAASDTILNRRVAVKMSRETTQPGADDPASIVRYEARILSSLTHPNLIAVLDCFGLGNKFGFVMPYYQSNLVDFRKDPRNDNYIEYIVPIFEAIAISLDYCVSQGVVHRDVKPRNILVGPDGTGVLCDFGICAQIDHDADWNSVVGTGPFISPEAILGTTISEFRQADLRKYYDQFGMGVSIYQTLTGELPFGGSVGTLTGERQSPTAEKLIAREQYPPCHVLNERLPVGVSEVVARMLNVNPSARFPSHRDAIDALRSAFLGRLPGAKSVFISYSRFDKVHVDRLAAGLENSSLLRVSYDQNFAVGSGWDDQVEEAMIDSDVMLVVLSRSSVISEEVRSEWNYWLGHLGRPILPLVLDDCRIPYRLFRLHHLILEESVWQDEDLLARRVIESIGIAISSAQRRAVRERWRRGSWSVRPTLSAMVGDDSEPMELPST